MQHVAEHLTQAQGQYLAFFFRMQQFLDMQYQTRIFLSLFFHALEPTA